MRNSTKTELRTLREVAHFLLPLVCCEFCGLPLLDPKLADKVFGDKAHTPLKFLKLTTHHRNGKHRDNRRSFRLLPIDENGEAFTTEQWNSNLNKMSVLQFAICGNTSLTHCDCHRRHEMKLNHHKRKVMKVKPLHKRASALLTKIINSGNELSVPETTFVNKISMRVGAIEAKIIKPNITRYEIRRLKKLAAKVEEKK